MSLFNDKSKIFSIQINSKKINEELCSLILDVEKNLSEFSKLIIKRDYPSIKHEVQSLYKIFVTLKQKTEILLEDVKRIVNIELAEKEFIILNDDQFIKDKVEQINSIKENLHTLMLMIEERPSRDAYENDLLAHMQEKITEISRSTSQMVKDDRMLEEIYSSLSRI